MKRKTRSTSIDGAMRALENVQAPPFKPPHRLSAKQVPIWAEILSRRGRDEWRPIDLRFAWELSDVLVRLRAESERLTVEGAMMHSDRGVKINPRQTLVQSLTKQAISLAIYLRIHPASEADYPTMVKGKRKAESEARELMPDADDPIQGILPVQ